MKTKYILIVLYSIVHIRMSKAMLAELAPSEDYSGPENYFVKVKKESKLKQQKLDHAAFFAANIHKNKNKSIDELSAIYDDERNSMISLTDTENYVDYSDFYEEMDNTIVSDNSMNMIFFGPASEFARIDSETILHLFQFTKKNKIPVARTLLAWDLITDGRTAAFLQGREYLAFDRLLNKISEEDLYYVNIGNPTVSNFFCNYKIDLDQRKAGIIISSFRRYYGNSWYRKGSTINEIGYLICSFTVFDLEQILPKVFWDLTIETMTKLSTCNLNQAKTLYKLATHPEAFGGPYSWGSLEVTRLGGLFNRIPRTQISLLHLEAVTGISPEVISVIDQSKLPYFSKQQILRMQHETRRKFILRMQLLSDHDMNYLFQTK